MTADELVAFAEDLSRIAAGGGGAKALAGHLAKRANVGVLVEDAQWRHLAAAGGSSMPSSVQPLLEQNASFDFQKLRNGHAGRTVAIVSGDEILGRLSIFGTGNLDAFEHAARLTASAIAVELAREAGAQPGRRRTFWEQLLAGAYHDAIAVRDDAASRGISLATHYVAVALETETREPAAFRAAALDAFRGGEEETGVLERSCSLVLFVPASREVDASNTRTAAAMLQRNLQKKELDVRISGGVGSRAALLEIQRSLAEAEAALSISRRLYGPGRVGIYEELGAYPLLLSGGSAEAMRDFARRTLAPLRTYDEKHQTELERTLRLYFSVGENVKTAAAELSVHRHTVFYRLRQIGEICGCKLDDSHDQLTLRMAIAIDALTA